MGNSIFRVSPRKTFNSLSGNSSNFQFAANQIIGWRSAQEDRYVCCPNFTEDFSYFAVYDGHGGEEVAEYLERFLHQFISKELELTKDVELSLYLGFLNCDSSLRSTSNDEFAFMENDVVEGFDVPDKAERRRFLFGSTDAAGTSGESQVQGELRAAVASTCVKELPSITYLTKAPIQESDESDDDYQPGDEDINFFADETAASDQSGDSSEPHSPESVEDDIMDVLDKEEKTEKNIASSFKDAGCSTTADMTENMDQTPLVMKPNEDNGSTAKEVKEIKEKQECNQEQDFDQQIGMYCGSTATVLLINPTKIFIANVGDSRCVACIKGQAVDLSIDHRPNRKEEYDRIIKAGGSMSVDGRIGGDIDMSRAFGDFHYKAMDSVEAFQILSVEPCISSLEISPDLEFIIVASDGIWNTMESADVIDYIRKRISDPSLELQDLCGELFEELLPEKITPDGSGCDNMTAIIIKFTSTQGLGSKNICYQETYEYRYPPRSNKSDNSSINKSNDSSTAENSKNCKDNSQLKLDEKNLNHEIFLKSKHEVAVQTDQQEINPSESCKEDSSQLDRNYNSNISQNCHLESGDNDQSILLHVNNMDKIMQAFNWLENTFYTTFQCINSKMNILKKQVDREIQSFYNQNLHSDSANLTSTNQSDEKDEVVDCSNKDTEIMDQSVFEGTVPQLTNEVNAEQSLLKDKDAQCSVEEIEMIDLSFEEPDNPVVFAKQPLEENKVDSQSVDKAVMQSHNIQVETHTVDSSKEIKTPEQSVESAFEGIVPQLTNEVNSEQSVIRDEDAQSSIIQLPSAKNIEEIGITDLNFKEPYIPVVFVKQPLEKNKVDWQSVDDAVMQSHNIQVETHPVDGTEEIKTPEQSVESVFEGLVPQLTNEVNSEQFMKDKDAQRAVIQLPLAHNTTDIEMIDLTFEKSDIPVVFVKQADEKNKVDLQSVDNDVMQSHIQVETHPVDSTNEEIKTDQSVEQDEVISQIDSAAMCSPSNQMEIDLVNDKMVQNPEQSIEKEEVVDYSVMQPSNDKDKEGIKGSCKETPTKKFDESARSVEQGGDVLQVLESAVAESSMQIPIDRVSRN